MKRLMMYGFACLFLVSCGSSVGVGGPGSGSLAKITVNPATPVEIRKATQAVFREQGFWQRSASTDSITFEKQGDRKAEMTWKTMGNSNPVMIRPTVSWMRLADDSYCLMCDLEVAQNSTVSGETVRRPMLLGKSGYSGLLKNIKHRVEAACR